MAPDPIIDRQRLDSVAAVPAGNHGFNDVKRALFYSGDVLIELRALPSKKRLFVRAGDLSGLRTFSRRPENLYFGVAARASDKDGTAENLAEIYALFADIDFKDIPEAEARERLNACPWGPPTLTVHSGGGLHAYWTLTEPLSLQTADARATVKTLLRQIATVVGGDLVAAEPARVLRLPGTLNRKYTPARPVTVEHFDNARRYVLADIQQTLQSVPSTVQTSGGHPREVEHDTEKVHTGQRNAHLTSLAGSMRRRGMSENAMVAALLVQNTATCHPPLDEHEVRQIAKSIGKKAPEATATNTPHPRRIVLTPASTITIKAVRWLWDGRMALGSFGLLGGREGIGKSIAAYTLTAGVTRGHLPGAYHGMPKSVVIVATEDSKAHTIVPRLMAAGADLERVHFVTVLTGDGTEGDLVLPVDVPELARVITDVDAALVLLDPLLSRLDATLDSHKDAEARRALEPLAKLADDTDACFLGIIHVNKATTSDPLTMLMASRAFAAVARWVLFAMADPADENKRLLGLAKSNLGRQDLPTLAYQVINHRVACTDSGDVWTGRLEWLGEAEGTIREALETTASGDTSATADAVEWLREYTAEADGPVDSAQAKRDGHAAGHSASAIRRARERLRLRVQNTDTTPRRTVWCLPAQSGHARGGTLTTDTTSTTGDIFRKNTHPVVPVVPVVHSPEGVTRLGDTTGPQGPVKGSGPSGPRTRPMYSQPETAVGDGRF